MIKDPISEGNYYYRYLCEAHIKCCEDFKSATEKEAIQELRSKMRKLEFELKDIEKAIIRPSIIGELEREHPLVNKWPTIDTTAFRNHG